MELVETTLTAVQRRAGAAWVPWRDLAAQQVRRGNPVRLLTQGEQVLLQVEDGTVRRGTVLRNVGSCVDGAYVITFGPEIRRSPVAQPEVEVQDVRVRRIPAQRRPVDVYL